MRFTVSLLALIAALSLPAFAQAQNDVPALPVDRVVLSTAGLAHIEHALTVDGAQDVRLPLRLDQVDDVMKSLIVFDAKGGVGGITLPGKQPLAQAFRDLPFQKHELDDPVLLLNAYQGATVTATVGGSAITGQLVRVTPEQRVTGDGLQETRYRLTLMTAEGLRSALLDEAQSLQFDDQAVKADIARALKSVRENATSAQRALTLSLTGAGRRDVRLAYVVDAPLWKAAYRMVLPARDADGQGFLQGWAVVENMTAADWKNVDLTLVSGNPVTFRQHLYQSYYVDRPEVPVEVLGRVLPRVDDGSVGTASMVESVVPQSARRMMKSVPAMPAAAPVAMDNLAMMESDSVAMGGAAGFAGGMDDVAQSVNAAASSEATTQVLFHFPARVTLASGDSLMMPFVSQEMAMTRVSVYQPDTHQRHPLAAVEMENKGKSGLPPGVLTLYEDGAQKSGTTYVGDARLPALAAGEKRLVSYALDNKVTVDRVASSDSRRGNVSLAGGVLRMEQTIREATAYTIKMPAEESRVVVIEHPRRGDFKLVAPKADEVEVTDRYYRVRAEVAAGEEKRVDVVLERTVFQTQAIADVSVDELLAYAGAKGELDADARAVFADLAKARRAIDAVDAEISALETERTAIYDDQGRLRENLTRVGGNSDLQQRYLKKLDEQESRLAAIEDEQAKLTARRQKLLADLQSRIAGAED